MRKDFVLVMVFLFAGTALADNEIREYTCNKVTGTPPVIDGNYTETEWAGSVFSGDFYGLRNDGNTASYQGKVINEKWQWRALWDDDYVYILMTADLKYINMNGWTWAGDYIDPLVADDTGYAGWGAGQNLDFECFLTPNWDDATTSYPNVTGNNPPGYQICYFPLLEDKDGTTVYAESNFGIRNKADGPPYFYTGTIGSTNLGGWNPIYDSAEAKTAGVKPFILAAEPHLIDGAVEGTDVVGQPVLEMAIPYSQMSLVALSDVTAIENVDATLLSQIMTADSSGKYVKAGDTWLINFAGYVDGSVYENTGLAYITWNDMGDGGFHNAPRGKLIFAGGSTEIDNWMMY